MTIYPLGALPEELYSRVGGKAKGLDLLVRNQFDVPRGFVVCEPDQVDEEALYR